MPTVTNGSFEIYVINNYGVYNERNDTKTLPVGVVVLDNVMRPDWAKGYLARDWNAALIHGFQDLSKPGSTFVTHFQADNQVNPSFGSDMMRWHERYDLIQLGLGDACVSYTVEAVRTLGLWDERWSTIFFQEKDYFNRALALAPDRTSLNDPGHRREYNTISAEMSPLNMTVGRQSGGNRGDANRPSKRKYMWGQGKLTSWFFKHRYTQDFHTGSPLPRMRRELPKDLPCEVNTLPRPVLYPYFENGRTVTKWTKLDMLDQGVWENPPFYDDDL